MSGFVADIGGYPTCKAHGRKAAISKRSKSDGAFYKRYRTCPVKGDTLFQSARSGYMMEGSSVEVTDTPLSAEKGIAVKSTVFVRQRSRGSVSRHRQGILVGVAQGAGGSARPILHHVSAKRKISNRASTRAQGRVK